MAFFAKTNKAKILHHLLETNTDTVSSPNDCSCIEDSNALVQVLKDLPPKIWRNMLHGIGSDGTQIELGAFN